MKVILKILAAILLATLVISNIFFGGINIIEGKNLFLPYSDTEFAPNYTPKKFDLIKKGQTIKEVEKILGKPLFEYKDSIINSIEYVYTSDGKLKKNNKDGDFAWYRSTIYFDSVNEVSKIDKGWSFD
ncbi:MAG: hypothetical protein RSF68_02535 [Myroides sp.]